jgi:hypothetical protein
VPLASAVRAPAPRETIVGRELAQFCAVRAPVSASARFVPSSARRLQVSTREHAATAMSPHISSLSRFVAPPVRVDLMLAFLRAPSQSGRVGEHRGPARTRRSRVISFIEAVLHVAFRGNVGLVLTAR